MQLSKLRLYSGWDWGWGWGWAWGWFLYFNDSTSSLASLKILYASK